MAELFSRAGHACASVLGASCRAEFSAFCPSCPDPLATMPAACSLVAAGPPPGLPAQGSRGPEDSGLTPRDLPRGTPVLDRAASGALGPRLEGSRPRPASRGEGGRPGSEETGWAGRHREGQGCGGHGGRGEGADSQAPRPAVRTCVVLCEGERMCVRVHVCACVRESSARERVQESSAREHVSMRCV